MEVDQEVMEGIVKHCNLSLPLSKASTVCSPFLSVVDCNRCNLDAQCKQSHPSPLVQEGCRTCRLVSLR